MPGTEQDGEPAGSSAGAPSGGPRAVATLDDTTRKTYRYLRVSVVAMALLLTTSLVVEIVWGGREPFGSISAYYYSPVRSILVGALVAIGPALIAIKGRPGWEDGMLDLAGMLIPVVALVPVPGSLGVEVCGPDVERCLPPELLPSIGNNVIALIVLGVAALVFAWWSSRGRRDRATIAGLLAATGVWATFSLWFWAGRGSFVLGAHYVAAVAFFLLIAGVAYINGRRARERAHGRLMSPRRYAAIYRVISLLMVVTIVVGGGLLALHELAGLDIWFATLFAAEAVVLLLFLVFWVLQTAENWDEEAAEDVAARRRPSPDPGSRTSTCWRLDRPPRRTGEDD